MGQAANGRSRLEIDGAGCKWIRAGYGWMEQAMNG